MRAPSSAAPPGGNGTMRRIGLVGYCACAARDRSAARIAASSLIMVSLRLHAGSAQNVAVAIHLLLDEGAEPLRRARQQQERLLVHRLHHIGAMHRRAE